MGKQWSINGQSMLNLPVKPILRSCRRCQKAVKPKGLVWYPCYL